MSKSTKETAVATKAEAKSSNVIKANSRGYAFFKKVAGCPDLSGLKKAEVKGEVGTPEQTVIAGKGEDAGNMLRKGYICIGPNAKAAVEFHGSRIEFAPVK